MKSIDFSKGKRGPIVKSKSTHPSNNSLRLNYMYKKMEILKKQWQRLRNKSNGKNLVEFQQLHVLGKLTNVMLLVSNMIDVSEQRYHYTKRK